MRIISLTNVWLMLVLTPFMVKSAAYRYPVAVLSDKNKVLVLSAQNQNELELFLFDRRTQSEQKILSSRYLPAGVRLLPDESGFSFIDDGILCIKQFDRRSAHLIEPSEPLYGIEYIQWLDNEFCYFHAFQDGHSGIYLMNREGEVITLLAGNAELEYLYPQIISGILFCIARTHKADAIFHYSIYTIPYQNLMNKNNKPDQSPQQVITIGTRPLALLHMISAKQGYVLEYPAERDSKDESFPITVYSLECVDGYWQSLFLFIYLVPSKLLFDPMNRLYESILPLMPYYGTEYIYYCSCSDENKFLSLYRYSLKFKNSQLCSQENRSLLGLYVVDNMLLYGGEIINDDWQPIKMLQIDRSN